MPQILVTLTTVSTREQARDLAQAIIDRRAAACVQVDGPIESYYRWDDKDQCDEEFRLIIKTSLDEKTRLHDLIRELHPYQQPQIVTLESIDVDPGYAAWVESQTGLPRD